LVFKLSSRRKARGKGKAQGEGMGKRSFPHFALVGGKCPMAGTERRRKRRDLKKKE